MLPFDLAREIGAWRTGDEMNIVGVHRDSRMLEVVKANVRFPLLSNVGGPSRIVMGDGELIVGMDILRPLGGHDRNRNRATGGQERSLGGLQGTDGSRSTRLRRDQGPGNPVG